MGTELLEDRLTTLTAANSGRGAGHMEVMEAPDHSQVGRVETTHGEAAGQSHGEGD